MHFFINSCKGYIQELGCLNSKENFSKEKNNTIDKNFKKKINKAFQKMKRKEKQINQKLKSNGNRKKVKKLSSPKKKNQETGPTLGNHCVGFFGGIGAITFISLMILFGKALGR